MVDQVSQSLFLQDNLLSEDDWGETLLNLVDLKDLTSSDSNSPVNDFCIGDEARYQDYSSPSNFSEDLGFGQHDSSPPMVNDCDFVDELLQDLLQTKSSQQINISDDVLLQQVISEPLGVRRHSTNTSSSSAYSSCSDSGIPSPLDHFSDHGSCSSGEFQDQEGFSIDLTSINDKCNNNFQTNRTRTVNEPTKSSRYKHRIGRTLPNCIRKNNCTEETELDRAVRLACEETNRLLNLHKSLESKNARNIDDNNVAKSIERQSTRKPEQDILKNLCEETILGNSAIAQGNNRKINGISSKSANESRPSKSKPLKRKASSLQNAIDRLQSANKTVCRSTQPTPFSRTALVSNNSKVQTQATSLLLESVEQAAKEQCIFVTQPQQPVRQKITLEGVNGSQTYTLTPTSPPPRAPVQFFIKQESPTYQPCSVVGGFIQSAQTQNTFSNQKVYVSTGTNSNISLSNPANNISIVNSDQLLCGNGGQTIVIQQQQQQQTQNNHQPSLMKPVTISNMKPGSEQPVVLSQSDLSRLASQGVIKFHANTKNERNLIPVTQETRMQIKYESKPTLQSVRKQAINPTVCDVLPNDAAGIINGTSVFINGTDNQPQRGELDVRALKRHQRMIKNRASACESRQRRKEYLKTLEDQTAEIADENKILRHQNDYFISRVRELEMENENLRKLIGIKQLNQKKAACLMMVVLFIGMNFFPVSLFGDNNPYQSTDLSLGAEYANGELVLPSNAQNPMRTGRHLLSFLNNDDAMRMKKSNGQAQGTGNKLMIPEKQSYWMDDLVQEYKNKHLHRFLQLLGETTPNSVKRMLRRKLKEELGISIPLPLPRNRRIAYTPRVARQRIERMVVPRNTRTSDHETTAGVSPTDFESSLFESSKTDIKMPMSLPQPCDKPISDETELNETETSRVNNDLTEWAERYSVERQEKAQRTGGVKNTEKKRWNTKSPSSRYEDFENTTSTNEIAVYTRPNKKFDDFLDAINRRNDTFYVVSLNRDHLLLPASLQNASARMKMALVMPAITSKERSTHGHISDEYETMIHIECEVVNTRMFDLKRKDVPEFLNVKQAKTSIKILDSSNDTITRDRKKTKNTKLKKEKLGNSVRQQKEFNKGDKIKPDGQSQNPEEDAVVSDVADYDFRRKP